MRAEELSLEAAARASQAAHAAGGAAGAAVLDEWQWGAVDYLEQRLVERVQASNHALLPERPFSAYACYTAALRLSEIVGPGTL